MKTTHRLWQKWKSQLMKCGECGQFCGFRFLTGLHTRLLVGATKRRFANVGTG